VINNISKLTSNLDKFNNHITASSGAYSSTVSQYNIKTIQEKTSNTIQLVKDYHNPGYVPVELELYGKQYYYHNQLLSKYFNFTGPGFVRDMNKLLDEQGISHIDFDEEPLLFKVIYPVKVQESIALNIDKTPVDKPKVEIESDLEFSDVEENTDVQTTPNNPPPTTTVTRAESKPVAKPTYNANTLVLEVFDYSMLDRDSVTISLNGKIILDAYQLQLQAESLYVELDPNGPNTLEVKALNDGMISPNTPSIAYRRRNQRKKVKLKPSLQAQEVLRIDIEL
jgi:cell division septation protein DedD